MQRIQDKARAAQRDAAVGAALADAPHAAWAFENAHDASNSIAWT